jgi:hypothetical protein
MEAPELIGILLCCVVPALWTVGAFAAGGYIAKNGWPVVIKTRLPGQNEEDQ